MADVFNPSKRSEIMSRIRSTNTKAELVVFRYLRREKIYFQKHYPRIASSPDIALPRKKKAVFIDGDFWHGRKLGETIKRLPEVYWQEKISKNVTRDKRNRRCLKLAGWRVLRVWESDIIRKSTQQESLEKIKKFLTD